nr:reverse transcriptase domain-containing protein [Tanacetum cinerariifolium]
MLPAAPPSPNYIPGPEELQTPPAPQDENEQEPIFIQLHYPDFIQEPIYLEYIPLEDDHVLPAEEQPLPPVVSPTAESPGYVAESDPEEDPEEYEDDEIKDDEEEEEEEHLALVDSAIVIPTDGGLETSSHAYSITITTYLVITTLCMGASSHAPAALPSPPLPPPLHMSPPIDRRDDIPEIEMPPHNKLCLSTLGSRYEARECSTARPIRGQGIDYGFVSTLDAEARRQGIRDVGGQRNDLRDDQTMVYKTIVKCLLDAYKGYHQIHMTNKDEEKTAFYTEEGVFYYTKMHFGLKNVGATYQRLVDFAFKEQIGVKLEAYVDDMVIKSRTEQDIIKYIEQTFSTLRRINMKFNPKKCSFGMEEGKFLGYIVTSKGIRANLEKAKAVMDMPSPKNSQEMQSLTNEAVSEVLVTKRDGRKMTLHYVSLSLQGAETNYASMEKLALALVHAARRLMRYLQAHPIKAVELGAYGITYVPRVAVKGQVLADFLADTPTKINATPKVASTPRMEDIPESSNAREILLLAQRPEDPINARTLMEKIKNYTMEDENLYRKSYLVVAKAMNLGYYWPSMHRDARELIKALERANKSLLRGIKTRLKKGGSAWGEEVPNVLWARRTMKKTGNSETPFSLTYSTEAVILVEIGVPTHRTSNLNEKTNDQELRLNLDLLDERREISAIREPRYKQQVEKHYNKKVRHVQFKVGEFVLRKNEASRAANTSKLGPTCEGPYKVIQSFQSGAYKHMKGEKIPRTWHACNL